MAITTLCCKDWTKSRSSSQKLTVSTEGGEIPNSENTSLSRDEHNAIIGTFFDIFTYIFGNIIAVITHDDITIAEQRLHHLATKTTSGAQFKNTLAME